jgi:hypothetical protein
VLLEFLSPSPPPPTANNRAEVVERTVRVNVGGC